MKIRSLVVTTLVVISISFVPSIFAHELETSQTVGAVMHMSPEDDPIVGEQTGFFFEFKDKENKFTPEKCDCTFSIEDSGKTIFSQNLFQENLKPTLENVSVFFTFPKKNIYKIKVVGEPIEEDAFNPFEIEYEVNVQREAAIAPTQEPRASQSTSPYKYPMFGLATLFILGSSLYIFSKKRK